ncbi:MAG: hypothetical protein AAGI70_14620, partial [Pseudomonadota bacterium]
ACGACPRGWSLFKAAGGRMIVGAGEHENAGVSEYPSFADDPGDATGGEERVTLTVAQMPRHSHQERGSNRLDVAQAPRDQIHVQDVDNTGFQKIISHESGGGQPHNNMPPYIALYFCKKD